MEPTRAGALLINVDDVQVVVRDVFQQSDGLLTGRAVSIGEYHDRMFIHDTRDEVFNRRWRDDSLRVDKLKNALEADGHGNDYT